MQAVYLPHVITNHAFQTLDVTLLFHSISHVEQTLTDYQSLCPK